MLGARTKQVFSYGRRNRRIVNDSHDPFDDVGNAKRSPVSRRIREPIDNGRALTPTVSPRVPSYHRPKKRPGDSKVESALKRRSVSGSGRQPLSTHSVNVSRQPAPGGPSKKPSLSGSRGASKALLPQSPVISVDIIVLDENGRRLSLERRSKSKVQVNQKKTLHKESPVYRQATATSVIVVSDSDDDDSVDAPSLQLVRRAKRWPKVMLSSDEEDVAEPPISLTSSPTSSDYNPSPTKSTLATSDIPKCPTPLHPKRTLPPKPRFWVEIVPPRPPPPSQSQPQALPRFQSPPEPTRNKPRQLTPIRRKGSTFTQIPPSTPTDVDISFDFDGLTLSSISYENPAPTHQPAHLLSLLDECGQSAPVEFSAFIEAFPVHPIVQSSCSGPVAFQKIGEASYSEVFGIGDIVLKIIPIRDEECSVRDDVDTPAPSDAKDILREIVVTRALGEMCHGFVSLLKTYVVRGRYPSLLLDLWDEYNQTKGSESVRPDMLAVSQVYAIIVLPNGGPDLEAYTFSQPTKTGWRQACSLFWQIVRALATAEDLVSFEHRDLHWGQILIKDVPSNRESAPTPGVRLPMDHPTHGVKATVIDLGLARMDACSDNGTTEIYWTPFDEEIFEGEGDYQFDIYRLIRKHNGSRWADFRPLTNVMWLHYLLFKLLKSKNLRPPRKSATATASPGFTERQCYECLLKMEGLLAQSLQEVRTHKLVTKNGRRKIPTPTTDITSGLQCAGDVLKFGETMRWV